MSRSRRSGTFPRERPAALPSPRAIATDPDGRRRITQRAGVQGDVGDGIDGQTGPGAVADLRPSFRSERRRKIDRTEIPVAIPSGTPITVAATAPANRLRNTISSTVSEVGEFIASQNRALATAVKMTRTTAPHVEVNSNQPPPRRVELATVTGLRIHESSHDLAQRSRRPIVLRAGVRTVGELWLGMV